MEHNTPCPIWMTSATLVSGSIGDSAKIWSDRTGGAYRISGTAAAHARNLSPLQKVVLTTWLIEQRRFGTPEPILNAEVLEEVLLRRPLRFSERINRLFQFLNFSGYNPSSVVVLKDDFPTVEFPFHAQHLMAWIEARDFNEGHKFLKLLEEDGLFRQPHFGNGKLVLSLKGFNKLEEAEAGGASTLQAFVAMWFDDEMKESWRTGFAPAIRDAGYQPFRIDNKEHNNKIDDEIVAEIKRSRFLIADFTCGGVEAGGKFEPNPRGGVYYEAGLAHGLGMEVIFTCRADRMAYAHFDTRQFAHIVWKTPADLRTSLYNRIAATLKEAPGAPGKGCGSVDPA